MARTLLSIDSTIDRHVVAARQYAREIAAAIGYDSQDQTRIATAVSEVARNACRYARGGKVEFLIEGDGAPQLLLVRVLDSGPGIPNLAEILEGRYRSRSGAAMGIAGARRLMDQCDISTGAGGTEVVLKKVFPPKATAFTEERIAALARSLSDKQVSSSVEEIQQQNRELVRALIELRERQEELSVLNAELEDTNRGVVALYAELDENAGQLRRADEMKSRFLSNMSHEFRTPLNSIRALSGLLLARSDGDLSAEQEKQVVFIQKAADALRELVDDLLDLAKIEAGKIDVHPTEISATTLFSALRGMLRPLLVEESVNLRFVEPAGIPTLYTDEAKISQILRNFISNALKFTERGEIAVSARYDEAKDVVTFAVADTGIGIRSEDQGLIFEEFTQLNNPLQRRAKGTGLGLPLCKRLAGLLGGGVGLTSQLGVGSTFTVSLPAHFAAGAAAPAHEAKPPLAASFRIPLLVVDDDESAQMFCEMILRETCYQVIPARSVREGRRALHSVRPAAIVLDIALRGEDGLRWLGELKADPTTRAIPVIVATSVNEQNKGLWLGANACIEKPVERAGLLRQLDELTRRRILVIDDDASMRYSIRRLLESSYVVIEAESGAQGLRACGSLSPCLVVLDLGLPDLKGEEVLMRLRDCAATATLPVLVATSRNLSDSERAELAVQATAVMSKSDLTDHLLENVSAALARGAKPDEIVRSHP